MWHATQSQGRVEVGRLRQKETVADAERPGDGYEILEFVGFAFLQLEHRVRHHQLAQVECQVGDHRGDDTTFDDHTTWRFIVVFLREVGLGLLTTTGPSFATARFLPPHVCWSMLFANEDEQL